MSGGVRLGEVAALPPAVAATELRVAQAAFDDALAEWWEHTPEEMGVLAGDLWYALRTLRDAIAGDS